MQRLALTIAIGVYLVGAPFFPAGAHTPSGASLQFPPELPSECRFLNVWIDYPREGTGMSSRDLVLNAKIAGLMKREFSNRGHGISEDPGDAYWSLLIMASNMGHGQYTFSATLKLRNLTEHHNSGLMRYPRAGEPNVPMTYAALSHGPRKDLRRQVREYVERANAALMPVSQSLCMFDAHDDYREQDLELQIPDAANHGG